jgi:voltage-gated potassium channel
MAEPETTQREIEAERQNLLHQLEDWLERPMIVLAFVWLALFVVEVVRGLGPLLESLGHLIWALFVLDFGIRLAVAPRKRAFLKTNWLTALSLLAPALRALRIVRALRLARVATAGRSLRLLRALSSINRGMRVKRPRFIESFKSRG